MTDAVGGATAGKACTRSAKGDGGGATFGANANVADRGERRLGVLLSMQLDAQ